jgi:hypothetical protein
LITEDLNQNNYASTFTILYFKIDCSEAPTIALTKQSLSGFPPYETSLSGFTPDEA